MVTNSSDFFWVTSRAAGTTAMVLSSVTVGYGLAMAARLRARPGGMATRRAIHEALSLGVMIAIVVHGLALLGDRYARTSVLDIAIPFAGPFERWWTTLGIVSGWALVLLGLAFYARERIGRERFKLIHRFTLVAWIAGLVHSVGEGSDAGQAWFIALLVISVLPAAGALALRGAKLLAQSEHHGAAARELAGDLAERGEAALAGVGTHAARLRET